LWNYVSLALWLRICESIHLQSPSEISVSPGQTVALECAVANVTADKVNMNWIRQSPGQKPEGVLFFKIDLSIYRAPGIPERYVPSRDASNKKFLLTIRDVQEGDDSIYFCFAFYTEGVQTWGEGTRVRVLSEYESGCSQEEIATGFATLTCLVSGFFPGYIDVLWRQDCQTQAQGVRTGLVALGEDKTYSVSSYLTVPANEWGSGASYSCVVKHESLPSREPLLPDPRGPVRFNLPHIPPSSTPSTAPTPLLSCFSGGGGEGSSLGWGQS
uniref:Ig-like domain-containing protein n=1 Tax=Chrysemys picta bellii TaxID=8478 RepID=A0A8C3HE99_CHRPI